MVRYFVILALFCTHLCAAVPQIRWQKSEITWNSEAQYRDQIISSLNLWQKTVSDVIKFREVSSDEKPDLVIYTDRTLEQSEYTAFVSRSYDIDRVTIISAKIVVIKPESDSLGRILTHEVGHVLGLPHNDNMESIMFHVPFYDSLHKIDAENICALYGVSPVEPDFGVTFTHLRGRKWLLKIKYDGGIPLWQSVDIRRNGQSRRYFEELGSEVICRVPRYAFQISLIYRGYLQTYVIEKPKKK
jgi:hypothetical protein